MTTSKRLAAKKIEKFERNIMKRGSGRGTSFLEKLDYTLAAILLAIFIFVVVGLYILQMVRMARG